jgi:hypothetical protein
VASRGELGGAKLDLAWRDKFIFCAIAMKKTPFTLVLLGTLLLASCQGKIHNAKLICKEFEQGKISVKEASEGLSIGDVGSNTDMAITAACSQINP